MLLPFTSFHRAGCGDSFVSVCLTSGCLGGPCSLAVAAACPPSAKAKTASQAHTRDFRLPQTRIPTPLPRHRCLSGAGLKPVTAETPHAVLSYRWVNKAFEPLLQERTV